MTIKNDEQLLMLNAVLDRVGRLNFILYSEFKPANPPRAGQGEEVLTTTDLAISEEKYKELTMGTYEVISMITEYLLREAHQMNPGKYYEI